MEKRKMNKLDAIPSLLGFGCMRFPMNEDGSINEKLSEEMIDYAISQGVNYIDTAYPYHDGDSEPFVGKVLNKYDRKDYFLATKLPVWNVEKQEDVLRIFNEQLERLDKDYVDFYLLHALDKSKWDKVLELDVLSVVEELQRQGKIKYLGFSFHDTYDVFEEILTYRDWDFCQIQYNYMDTVIQAGDKGYQLTCERNVPLVIMEPIKGGSLTRLPKDLASILTDYDSSKSLASWALRWVASHNNVKVILSGMSDYQQVEDNIQTFKQFKPLNDEEMAVISHLHDEIISRQKNGCTACSYCMPCPFGVNIPKNFQYWNEASMYGNPERLKNGYQSLKEAAAEYCKQCGACEKMCPQHISIREDLKQIIKDYQKIK
jgi:Predicted oxidoreductases of the aldo/keto reductase family